MREPNPENRIDDLPRVPELTATEVMAILRKDRSTVMRMARDGRIAVYGRVPGYGVVLFDRASVEAYAARIADELRADADALQARAVNQ